MPRYQHDCSKCKPLGEFGEFDLYYCETEVEKHPTVIARYGNEGHEYNSGLELADLNKPLGEAKRRAIKNGLLSV